MSVRVATAVYGILFVIGVLGVVRVVTRDAEEFTTVHFASYAQEEFYTGILQPDPIDAISERVYGGIVSHHFYAEREIAAFFSAMRGQHPRTVVIISPNHFSAGSSEVLISQLPYDTPWGILSPDTDTGRSLVQETITRVDEQPFEREHGVSALVGFVKHTFPDAKLLPILVRQHSTTEEAIALGRALDEYLPEDSLVIASVDFSHHLHSTAAAFHDQKSIAAIAASDIAGIASSEVDSPQSLIALVTYLQERGAQRFLMRQSSSALIGNNHESEDVTSYVFAHAVSGMPTNQTAHAMLHFGDTMFGRAIAEMLEAGQDPFASIRGPEGNFLRGIDTRVLNLEGVLTDSTTCPPRTVQMLFAPDTAYLLRRHRITLVHLANNHAGDCGQAGVDDTIGYLQGAGIETIGTKDQPSYTVTKGGRSIAVLGVDGLGRIDKDTLIHTVKALDVDHDDVVVHVHWGVEYNTQPSQEQKEFAHLLVESGADTVIGHHPHVVQPLEIYRGRAIFYSLGNFIFDQTLESTLTGLGVGTVYTEDAATYYLFPFTNQDLYPTHMSYPDAQKFCDEFVGDSIQHGVCTFTLPV